MDTITAVLLDPRRRASLEQRLWSKIDRRGDAECWPWTARARHPFGYGRMTAGRGNYIKAHRAVFALTNGPIPEGAVVCHRCDNPGCCNPSHLFLGNSNADNMADMDTKGRRVSPPHSYGEKHHNAKLTASQAAAIVADARAAWRVADEYGVSDKTVYRLRRGETWVKGFADP